MKITLIQPPSVTHPKSITSDALPPIGLAYISASLKSAGHHVHFVDSVGEGLKQFGEIPSWPGMVSRGLSFSEVFERIPEGTEMIGVSCQFSATWPYNHQFLDALRDAFPGVFIVIGGEHVTALPEYILTNHPSVDFCVLGEGENSIVELANGLERGLQGEELFDGLTGVAGRMDGEVKFSKPNVRIKDVDEIPEPDWESVPLMRYIDSGYSHGVDLGRSMPIMASRGCPYQCTFCSNPLMYTPRWFVRKPEFVIEEMKKYIERYQVTNFDFYDLTAIVKRDWIVEFSKMVIRDLPPITWQLPSGTRSEAIDAEVSRLMYESGCRNVNYAPESGNVEVLEMIKKKVKISTMLDSMRSAYKNGLEVKSNIIIGFPKEQKRQLFQTFGFTARMAWIGVHDISAFPFSPYPGSELFAQLLAEKKIELGEEYFRSLMSVSIIGKSESANDEMSDRYIRTMTNLLMAWFYGLSFLFRPIRAWNMVYRILITRRPKTRLENALAALLEKNSRATA
ncbi:B12-binding domain-containing radical SAM protein [Myxococcota bacterium]|nr:B12-binding domain-containing radical SAM protein [Myxococcota bacterium]